MCIRAHGDSVRARPRVVAASRLVAPALGTTRIVLQVWVHGDPDPNPSQVWVHGDSIQMQLFSAALCSLLRAGKLRTPNPDPSPNPSPKPSPNPSPNPNPFPNPNPTPDPNPTRVGKLRTPVYARPNRRPNPNRA